MGYRMSEVLGKEPGEEVRGRWRRYYPRMGRATAVNWEYARWQPITQKLTGNNNLCLHRSRDIVHAEQTDRYLILGGLGDLHGIPDASENTCNAQVRLYDTIEHIWISVGNYTLTIN